MIKLSNVHVSYADKKVLEDISLNVKKGEHIAIMGRSGSGKTTLAKIIAGHIKQVSGEAEISSRKISYVFQEPRLLPWLTAKENIVFPIGESEENDKKAKSLLKELELDNDADKLPDELSGGMQQRVSIARALAFEGEILILDEPFSALDTRLKEKVISLIKKRSENSTRIIITHNINDARALSDIVYYIEDKHIRNKA